ncbi:DUF6318 family protein [Kribbella sp. NBC_00382]
MTTRNRQATALTLACLCAAALAGCNNKSPEAGRPNTAPPQSSATTNTTASTPSSAGSTPPSTPTDAPTRPALAAGSTLAAGEAFIGYYVDLLNYAYSTGDAELLLAESDKGCVGCKGIAGYVRKINAKNGGLQGDFKDRLIDVKEIYRGKSGHLGGSASLKSGTFQERATPGASPVPQPAGTGTMEFTLSPSAGNWVMYEMQINE